MRTITDNLVKQGAELAIEFSLTNNNQTTLENINSVLGYNLKSLDEVDGETYLTYGLRVGFQGGFQKAMILNDRDLINR